MTHPPPAPIAKANGRRRAISDLLEEIARTWPKDRLTLAELMDQLGDRGYGVLLVVFALPNLIPISIPGLSAVLGLPLAFIAAQMMLARRRPWLPRVMLERSIAISDFARMMVRALPILKRVERILKPRLIFMTVPMVERGIGLLVLVLSLLLALPVPFTNIALSLPILLCGLALIERDGLIALIAANLGGAAIALSLLAGWALVKTGWRYLFA